MLLPGTAFGAMVNMTEDDFVCEKVDWSEVEMSSAEMEAQRMLEMTTESACLVYNFPFL